MNHTRTLPRTLVQERQGGSVRHGLRTVLGPTAWSRLPEAVRERFADAGCEVTYAGSYELVRASWLGLLFAWLGTLFGMPVVARTGVNVASCVRVRAVARGVAWDREYHWADGTRHVVRSIKEVAKEIGAEGRLIERLPARLCMPLDT